MPTFVRTVVRDWLHAQNSLAQLAAIGREEAQKPPAQQFTPQQRASYRNAIQHFEDVRALCGQTLAVYMPAANDAVVAEPAEAP